MHVRPATVDDLGFCHDLARRFIDSTRYRIRYDPEVSQNSFWTYLNSDDRALLIAVDNGVPVGGVMLACSYEFATHPFCYLVKLFVLPEFRGSEASRLLINRTTEWAAEKNCSYIFANAGAAITESLDIVAGNLYRRVGFADAGKAYVLPVSENEHERIK